MAEKFRCPMRPKSYKDNIDTWELSNGWLYCSNCRTPEPDQFIEYMKTGGSIQPLELDDRVSFAKGRVYYAHFGAHHMMDFCHYVNVRKCYIVYPGYFPVLPYFARFENA